MELREGRHTWKWWGTWRKAGKKESSKIRVTFTKHWSSVRHCSKCFRCANSLNARYTPTRQGGTTRRGGTRWACEVNPHKGPTGTETACHTPQSTANVQNLEIPLLSLWWKWLLAPKGKYFFKEDSLNSLAGQPQGLRNGLLFLVNSQ